MLYTKELGNIIRTMLPEAARYQYILESAGGLFEKEILPSAKKIDQNGTFPRQNLELLQREKIMGMPFPKEYAGSALPFTAYAAVIEMLASACANTALQLSIQGMITEGLELFGTAGQKEKFLKEKGLAVGRCLIAFALTEPCCGSDARSIRSTAAPEGNAYILNGSKIFITNAAEADFTLVFAATKKGISAFIVPKESSGFIVLKDMPKLGFRGNRLNAVQLKDCRVPGEYLLGEEGKGLEYAKQILNSGRLTIAAIAVGIAQSAYEKARLYSKKREAFGESLSHFQLIQEKLADMATGIRAARLMTYCAAAQKDGGMDIAAEAAQAKLFASETAVQVCDKAMQIHGGYGYVDDFDIHRHWRDSRMLLIGEGTSDMLRLLIAHLELK